MFTSELGRHLAWYHQLLKHFYRQDDGIIHWNSGFPIFRAHLPLGNSRTLGMNYRYFTSGVRGCDIDIWYDLYNSSATICGFKAFWSFPTQGEKPSSLKLDLIFIHCLTVRFRVRSQQIGSRCMNKLHEVLPQKNQSLHQTNQGFSILFSLICWHMCWIKLISTLW